jgi:hypothetical protein
LDRNSYKLDSRRKKPSAPRVFKLETFQHKEQHVVPVFETDIPGKRADVGEKGFPGGKIFSYKFIPLVEYFQNSMKQKRYENEAE